MKGVFKLLKKSTFSQTNFVFFTTYKILSRKNKVITWKSDTCVSLSPLIKCANKIEKKGHKPKSEYRRRRLVKLRWCHGDTQLGELRRDACRPPFETKEDVGVTRGAAACRKRRGICHTSIGIRIDTRGGKRRERERKRHSAHKRQRENKKDGGGEGKINIWGIRRSRAKNRGQPPIGYLARR